MQREGRPGGTAPLFSAACGGIPAAGWRSTRRRMMPHRIRDFETFTVELPIEAPLRHSYAVHSAFKRTLLCLTTEDGLSGWGETAAPERLLREFRSVVVGEDPFHLEKMSMRISQRGYHSRQEIGRASC